MLAPRNGLEGITTDGRSVCLPDTEHRWIVSIARNFTRPKSHTSVFDKAPREPEEKVVCMRPRESAPA